MVDANFIRNRITQLRLQKGVSEYQMGYDLGHSRSYVYNISSGKSLPPLPEFLEISVTAEVMFIIFRPVSRFRPCPSSWKYAITSALHRVSSLIRPSKILHCCKQRSKN